MHHIMIVGHQGSSLASSNEVYCCQEAGGLITSVHTNIHMHAVCSSRWLGCPSASPCVSCMHACAHEAWYQVAEGKNRAEHEQVPDTDPTIAKRQPCNARHDSAAESCKTLCG